MTTEVKNPAITENANIRITVCSSYEEMKNRVASASMGAGVTTTPGTLYMQGERYCFQTAFGVSLLTQITTANRPDKKSGISDISTVASATNRPLEPGHAKTIGRYVEDALVRREPYILPSITLNIPRVVDMIVVNSGSPARAGYLTIVNSGSPARAGYLIMPLGMHLDITDGQHRIEGLKLISDKCTNESIGVMITFSPDKAQIHQDFADCAKTKSISPSQLSVYDSRNLANGIALDLAEHPLFAHTVDAVRKSISKRSIAVWTLNQVRVMIKWAMLGSQCIDDVFADNASKLFAHKNSEQYKAFLGSLTAALDIFAGENELLKKLVAKGSDLANIAQLREEENSLLMTGSGLATFGYLWYRIRQAEQENPRFDTLMAVRRIAKINWRNDSPLFRDNLRINPARINSGQKYVKMAGDSIWAITDIQLAA